MRMTISIVMVVVVFRFYISIIRFFDSNHFIKRRLNGDDGGCVYDDKDDEEDEEDDGKEDDVVDDVDNDVIDDVDDDVDDDVENEEDGGE